MANQAQSLSLRLPHSNLWPHRQTLVRQPCHHTEIGIDHQRVLARSPDGGRCRSAPFFADGVSASIYCSLLNQNQQWANLSGTKGYVHVPGFVCPFDGSEVSFDVSNTKFVTNGCDFNMEDHTRRVAIAE